MAQMTSDSGKSRLGDAAKVKILRDAVGRCRFMHVSIGIDGGALVFVVIALIHGHLSRKPTNLKNCVPSCKVSTEEARRRLVMNTQKTGSQLVAGEA
jgi:hypothetical protein